MHETFREKNGHYKYMSDETTKEIDAIAASLDPSEFAHDRARIEAAAIEIHGRANQTTKEMTDDDEGED